MVFIYSLKLQSGKYYIGKTDSPNFRLQDHFDSSRFRHIFRNSDTFKKGG
jgi:predicted GIY-YIG superfamily endonuclease